jgi:hypothetical protein
MYLRNAWLTSFFHAFHNILQNDIYSICLSRIDVYEIILCIHPVESIRNYFMYTSSRKYTKLFYVYIQSKVYEIILCIHPVESIRNYFLFN